MLSANGQVLCGWEVQLSCKQALLSTLRALSVLPTLFCPETHDGVGGLRYPPDICGEESAESRPVSVSLDSPWAGYWKTEKPRSCSGQGDRDHGGEAVLGAQQEEVTASEHCGGDDTVLWAPGAS